MISWQNYLLSNKYGFLDQEHVGVIKNIVENADTLLKIDCIKFDTLKDEDKIKQNILEARKVIYARN